MARTDAWHSGWIGVCSLLIALVVGCTQSTPGGGRGDQPATATAALSPTEGNRVSGKVTFTLTEDGVRVVARVTGLTPGEHGFHVHEVGDCSAPDGSSAGGHFNPMATPHAGPDDEVRHVGDLGNLVADAEGNATLERMDRHLAFEGPASIIGRAVIVHANRDDLSTQPTGAAGARVACGVIERDGG